MKRYTKIMCVLSFLFGLAMKGEAQNLLTFSGEQTQDGILLEWNLVGGASSTDTFFIVRSSILSPAWIDVTTIEGQNGVEDYSFLDTGPFVQDEYFYRITWVSTFQAFVTTAIVDYFADAYFLTGQVAFDESENCLVDGNETGLSDYTITGTDGSNTYYASSDADGYYSLVLPNLGNYDVSISVTHPYWESCSGPVPISTTPNGSSELDYPLQKIIDCPYMEVDLGTPFLVRCFDSDYYVNYCNRGTALAEDAKVEVTFDDFLIVNSSSIPWSTQVNNVYIFELGDLDVDECGSFSVNVTVDCDAVLGQTHCSEAYIYPDTLCAPIDPLWDQSSIIVEADCMGDNVVFTVTNVGTSNMTSPLDYMVIEDNVMLFQGELQLDAGQQHLSSYIHGGSTLRLEVDQSAYHPGMSNPSVTIEGCGAPVSLGYVVMFPEDDADPFISIDCRENLGSFDPNDKQAYPRGFGDEHYIKRGQDIEYHIRFQNTGTAPAVNVRIEDVIDENLDLLSIRPGASSHPYEFELSLDGTVNFIFDEIYLPDSTSNEAASHGFVKFRIQQKADLPLGTQIKNEAAIYFDFNDPVITNETWHTIGEEFILVNSINTVLENVSVNVYPNPFIETATFKIEGMENQEFVFQLFDLSGKLLKAEKFNNSNFELDGSNLLSGMYIFEISNDKGKVSTGKILVN